MQKQFDRTAVEAPMMESLFYHREGDAINEFRILNLPPAHFLNDVSITSSRPLSKAQIDDFNFRWTGPKDATAAARILSSSVDSLIESQSSFSFRDTDDVCKVLKGARIRTIESNSPKTACDTSRRPSER